VPARQQHLQLFFDLDHQRFQSKNLIRGHGPHLGVFIRGHDARLFQLARSLLPFAILGNHFGESAVRLGRLAIRVAIVDHDGVGQLGGQLLEASFDLVQFV